MPSETIAIASDHGAVELKEALTGDLKRRGFSVLDLGTDGLDSVDYPDFADALATAIREGRAARGVLLCGSGIGMSIAANRHREIRAALVHDHLAARLARQHNDANVLCIGSRVVGAGLASEILKAFLNASFEGGRHERRVNKIEPSNEG